MQKDNRIEAAEYAALVGESCPSYLSPPNLLSTSGKPTTIPMNVCIFCFQGPNNPQPYCKDNPGDGCTYGLHHEFPGSEYTPPKQLKKPQPAKKPDKQVCTKCGLHARNPASAASECQHEYPT